MGNDAHGLCCNWPGDAAAKGCPGMTWKPVTPDQRELFEQVMLWIRTVRETGAKYGLMQYGSDWLPSSADFDKSALLERIRSGHKPLDEPPPVAYSCPWYAVVEDRGPHYIFDVTTSANYLAPDEIAVAQNRFKIYERNSDTDFIVGDIRGTSYRFHLWYDADWEPRSIAQIPRKGGWFIQDVIYNLVPGQPEA